MLQLTGLTPAPAQVRGAFRLVPLIRDVPCQDVRLSKHAMPTGFKQVDLPDNTHYFAFIPHGVLLEWERSGEPLAALGGQVKTQDSGDWLGFERIKKMRKRESQNSLRFLPLHMALEGLLALHFSPPKIKWAELSESFHRIGLGSRSESGVMGHSLPGFEDALRTFELHQGQVGMLVFVADELAAAFVVPSARDYKLMHRTLLTDLYGELVMQYAVLFPESNLVEATPHFEQVKSIQDLYASLSTMRRDWAEFTEETLLSNLLNRPLKLEEVYQPGKLLLERFITDLDLQQVNHVGERLTRKNGELLYLKTFQLSASQTRRAYLLSQLAEHEWHLESAARACGQPVCEWIRRLEKNGFGYLVNQNVREQAAKAARGQK